jgi:putative ABC transport system substrate-binding protein
VRQDVEAAAAATGVKAIVAEVAKRPEVEPALKAMSAANVQALLIVGDPMFAIERDRIAKVAMALRLPTIWNDRSYVEAGGLMSYGINLTANQRRAAYFVDKILKGAKPADLPVEFPTKIEMVINLKTAKALGLTIPPAVLALADELIE